MPRVVTLLTRQTGGMMLPEALFSLCSSGGDIRFWMVSSRVMLFAQSGRFAGCADITVLDIGLRGQVGREGMDGIVLKFC